jgi:hypothetical protein
MLNEKDEKLAELLATNMPQMEACNKAGFKCNSRTHASALVKARKKNPEFVEKIESYKLVNKNTQDVVIMSNLATNLDGFVINNYIKLINSTLNGEKWNPAVARAALRDLAEMCQLFQKLNNTKPNTTPLIEDIETLQNKLNNLKIINQTPTKNNTTPFLEIEAIALDQLEQE